MLPFWSEIRTTGTFPGRLGPQGRWGDGHSWSLTFQAGRCWIPFLFHQGAISHLFVLPQPSPRLSPSLPSKSMTPVSLSWWRLRRRLHLRTHVLPPVRCPPPSRGPSARPLSWRECVLGRPGYFPASPFGLPRQGPFFSLCWTLSISIWAPLKEKHKPPRPAL